MNKEEFSDAYREFFNSRNPSEFALLKTLGEDKKSSENCLVYHLPTGGIYKMEDSQFEMQLCTEMINRGLPVYLADELPPARTEPWDIYSDLIETSTPFDLRKRAWETIHLRRGEDRGTIAELIDDLKSFGVTQEILDRIEKEFQFQVDQKINRMDLNNTNDRRI